MAGENLAAYGVIDRDGVVLGGEWGELRRPHLDHGVVTWCVPADDQSGTMTVRCECGLKESGYAPAHATERMSAHNWVCNRGLGDLDRQDRPHQPPLPL